MSILLFYTSTLLFGSNHARDLRLHDPCHTVRLFQGYVMMQRSMFTLSRRHCHRCRPEIRLCLCDGVDQAGNGSPSSPATVMVGERCMVPPPGLLMLRVGRQEHQVSRLGHGRDTDALCSSPYSTVAVGLILCGDQHVLPVRNICAQS